MHDDISEQTIAAVATAHGTGAISIVRLSGPEAFAVLDRVFKPAVAGDSAPRKMVAGDVVDPGTGGRIDSVLAVRFPAPHSYTGENSAEIHAHGGVFVTSRVFELLSENGARAAWPGEFTMRAFVNGKVDLTQAEAVNDIINARNEHSLKLAMGALKGSIGGEIRRLRAKLVDLLAKMEVAIEYPDEDFEEIPRSEVTVVMQDVMADIGSLIGNFQAARMVNQGPRIALAGRPNVGKSSLMNRLLGEKRSIIHHSPGTTRDLVGDYLLVSGVNALIMDTAGISETQDPVEQEGVARTWEFVESADIVLLVLDGSERLSAEDVKIMDMLRSKGIDFIPVINKMDLEQKIGDDEVNRSLNGCCRISALTGQGIDDVLGRLSELVNASLNSLSDTAITNSRHKDLLDRAYNALSEGLNNVHLPQDVLTIDIRNAIDQLGRVTGENTTDDVLHTIFNSFCVGK